MNILTRWFPVRVVVFNDKFNDFTNIYLSLIGDIYLPLNTETGSDKMTFSIDYDYDESKPIGS